MGPINPRTAKLTSILAVPWREVVKRDPCPYCCLLPDDYTWKRHTDTMSVEHVAPRSPHPRLRGWENLAGAHKSCNHDRGDLPLLLFLLLRQRLATCRGRANKGNRRRISRAMHSVKAARWRQLRMLDTVSAVK